MIGEKEAEFSPLKARRVKGEASPDFLAAYAQAEEFLSLTNLLKTVIDSGRIVPINFFDTGEQRQFILKELMKFPGIPKANLSFSSINPAQQLTYQKLVDIASEATELLTNNDLSGQEIMSLRAEVNELQNKIQELRARSEEHRRAELSLKERESFQLRSSRLLDAERQSLTHKKTACDVLQSQVDRLTTSLRDLDSDTLVQLSRQEYEVTHAESAGRALFGLIQGVTGVAWTAATLGAGYGMAAAANRYVNYTKLRYDGGIPYKKVTYSYGIDGHVKYDLPAEGKFCYRLNVLGSTNGIHSITVWTEKRILNRNEIARLKEALGETGRNGKLQELKLLKDEITALEKSIRLKSERLTIEEAVISDENERLLRLKKATEEEIKRHLQQKHQIENSILPEKQRILLNNSGNFKAQLALYQLAYQIIMALQLHQHERADFRRIVAAFHLALTKYDALPLLSPGVVHRDPFAPTTSSVDAGLFAGLFAGLRLSAAAVEDNGTMRSRTRPGLH